MFASVGVEVLLVHIKYLISSTWTQRGVNLVLNWSFLDSTLISDPKERQVYPSHCDHATLKTTMIDVILLHLANDHGLGNWGKVIGYQK